MFTHSYRFWYRVPFHVPLLSQSITNAVFFFLCSFFAIAGFKMSLSFYLFFLLFSFWNSWNKWHILNSFAIFSTLQSPQLEWILIKIQQYETTIKIKKNRYAFWYRANGNRIRNRANSVFELGQQFFGISEGSSGLSVLRTFRLLRILKLVRFMPNLRRQLFVMLRTMDNVAIFFSLLILFIFIFR